MRVSVIVRSRDEAQRLRLCLASLAHQSVPAEVVVVNDGSVDGTPLVLAEAAAAMPLIVVAHPTPRGRSAAANAGARVARGEILMFMDGDTLAGPDAVARHLETHETARRVVARGETFHLRGTRFFLDPETGAPYPGEGARLARVPAAEIGRMRVTLAQVTEDFADIERRSQPAIYPGAGPRRLYELEMDALRRHPDCGVLWAAASGSNQSVRAEDFHRTGGFREDLHINEHRELALRLCESGARMVPVTGARSYHLTHRSGWRDPLRDTAWERVFFEAHPTPAVKLLAIFWAGLSNPSPIPPEARIDSLPALEAAAQDANGVDYDAVRRLIPALPVLRDVADRRRSAAVPAPRTISGRRT